MDTYSNECVCTSLGFTLSEQGCWCDGTEENSIAFGTFCNNETTNETCGWD